ncbi:hypothetical protein [Arthrobacter sp. 18067]|uniref:hypothetical protein n=1 Tax=Arthrobacter sp. 18067 TaxID=2681413 RepID=UPI00135B9761|nr:hypothetical protein [Arthrobacter sp. 18067]
MLTKPAQAAGQEANAEPNAEPNPAGTSEQEQAPAAAASAGQPEQKDADTFTGLPDQFSWLKEGYEKRGTEASSLREQLEEVQTKLAAAKSPEEFAAVQTQSAELGLKLAVESAARKHNLSDEAIVLLDGVPADQIETRAEALAKLIAPAPPAKQQVTKTPLRGGSKPGEDAADEDGAKLWRQYRDNQ